ncbi:hypothetical protein AKO1_014006, partial [Acrasis kona]
MSEIYLWGQIVADLPNPRPKLIAYYKQRGIILKQVALCTSSIYALSGDGILYVSSYSIPEDV